MILKSVTNKTIYVMRSIKSAWAQGVLMFVLICASQTALAERCLFVSSYHPGYDWADGIEKGIRSVLSGKCDLKQINMDTKRNKDPEYIQAKALEIKNFIDEWKPDVLIAADDNASKYLVMPYYRDAELPVVFCGINWTVQEYGYPYKNVTGMIEVSPIREMFEKIQQILSNPRVGAYLGANTLTEQKSYERFKRVAQKYNIRLESRLSSTMSDWSRNYIDAQKGDFLILGTTSGINDWDDDAASRTVYEHAAKLSLTDYDWMMAYALIGMTKVAEEQGRWAANTALKILAGTDPSSIPIIPNRDWDMYINAGMLARSSLELPQYLIIKSKMVHAE